jgi:hypothetical protein
MDIFQCRLHSLKFRHIAGCLADGNTKRGQKTKGSPRFVNTLLVRRKGARGKLSLATVIYVVEKNKNGNVDAVIITVY